MKILKNIHVPPIKRVRAEDGLKIAKGSWFGLSVKVAMTEPGEWDGFVVTIATSHQPVVRAEFEAVLHPHHLEAVAVPGAFLSSEDLYKTVEIYVNRVAKLTINFVGGGGVESVRFSVEIGRYESGVTVPFADVAKFISRNR